MKARLSPQDWSRRASQYLLVPFGAKDLQVVLWMRQKGAINTLQISQKIVQVGIVIICKRTHLGLINFHCYPAPPDFWF